MTQSNKFKAIAKEIEADSEESTFNRTLKDIVNVKMPSKQVK